MIKRLFDLILVIIGLIFLSPLILILFIVVYFKMGSPIFFRQERPGKNGKAFKLYKLRSMTNEKDENGQLLPNEKRLTAFGKTLRATSLDELPSLINVLKGEMSLVGPRPLRFKYMPYFTKEQNRRHEVLPGITGYAQVNGRNKNTWEEKFALDIWYVDNQSLLLDIKILVKTFVNVVNRKDITPTNQDFEIPFDEYIIQKKYNDRAHRSKIN